MRTGKIRDFLAMFLLGFSLALLGQSGQAQEILWISPYGGRDVATDSAENVLITSGGRTVKFTPDGDTLWKRNLDLNSRGIAADPWGNVIVTGYTHWDYCTVKYGPDGDTLWTRTFKEGEKAYGVATDPWGNIIVTGYTGSYDPCGDYLTIKYDPEGNMLWKRVYNWEWEDYAQDVAVDREGNVIVTGWSDNDINWDWCTVKYGPGGDTLWIRRVDIGIDDFPYGVATDPWGNVIVVGGVDIGGGHRKAFVIKYNSDGDTIWTRLYYEIGELWDVATDTSGNIVVIKTIYSTPSAYYTLIMKLDASGDTLWTSRCDSLQCDGVTTDQSGNVIVTGNKTVKYRGNSGVEGENDYSFPKVFSLLQNYPNPFNSATLIPYHLPAVSGQRSAVSLKIYNLLGQEVKTLVDKKQASGYYSVRWDGKDDGGKPVASGVYLCRLNVRGLKAESRKLKAEKTRKLVLLR